MALSISSFEIVLFYKKIKYPARQVRAPKLVELVSLKHFTYIGDGI
jgi:hypothetical protein